MPRLCPPILTRTGKHTLLRHYLRVSTFHRSIVIDLHAKIGPQDYQHQDAEFKIAEIQSGSTNKITGKFIEGPTICPREMKVPRLL